METVWKDLGDLQESTGYALSAGDQRIRQRHLAPGCRVSGFRAGKGRREEWHGQICTLGDVLGWWYFWAFLFLLCRGCSLDESWAYIRRYLCLWTWEIRASLAHWPSRSLLSGPVCLCALSPAVHFLDYTHSSSIICGKSLFTMETSHSVEVWETYYSVRRSMSIGCAEIITNHSDQVSSSCSGLHSEALPLCWSL